MTDSPQIIYDAIEEFTKRFLLGKKSIFSDNEVFTEDNLNIIKNNFSEKPDESGESFDKKIQNQFSKAVNEVKELFAHAVWLWGIFDYDQKRETKVSNVESLVSLNLDKDFKISNTTINLFPDVVIGSAGIYHKTNKYHEICYILAFFEKCWEHDNTPLTVEGIVNIIKGLTDSKDGKKIAMYNILLHLFAPAKYERIASYGHKEKIIKFFTNEFKQLASKHEWRKEVIAQPNGKTDIDDKLSSIRKTICENREGIFKQYLITEDDAKQEGYFKYIFEKDNLTKFDFYLNRVERLWNSELVLESKNIILHGAPGTGKTYSVESNIKTRLEMLSEQDASEQYCLVQFHPSYGYEDFIDGIKPKGITNGQIQLELVNGQFKELCIKAFNNLLANKEKKEELKNYYFVADEINRAELSRVFGEVLLCLEEDKRLRFNGDKLHGSMLKTMNSSLWTAEHAVVIWDKNNKILVPYQKYDQNNHSQYEFFFGVPENLYFIGTMNDIDRSIDSFDMALRRRFFWIQTKCDYDVISRHYSAIGSKSHDITSFIERCKELNKFICEDLGLGSSYELGHAYFMHKDKSLTAAASKEMWNNHIQPLLREYLRSLYSEKELEIKLEAAKSKFLAPEANK